MGWRFRRSINVGFGFRINLSKSGIGYSWGFPGYRVTKMATGGTRTTYSLPGTGISYVEQTGKNNNREDMLYLGETKNYKNIPVSEIQKNDPILKKINNVMFFNRVSNFLILLSLGSYYNPIFIVNLILGLIIKLIIYTSNRIGIYYEFDEESREMYDSLKEVFIKLSNNKKMWQVNSATQVYNTKYNAGVARNMSGCSAFITTRIPWYIKTNIDIYGFNLKNEKLFFTPDRVIVFRPFRKAFGCSYEHMKLFVNSTKFVEARRVCNDAIVEDYTWRYANKDGGRDLRFTSNKRFPICKYGEFSIESPYGINTKIIFSNFNIAKDMKSDLLSFGEKCIKILTKEKLFNKNETVDENITSSVEYETIKPIECIKCHSTGVECNINKKDDNLFEEEHYTCLNCGKKFTDKSRLGASFNNIPQIILNDVEKKILKWIIIIIVIALIFIWGKSLRTQKVEEAKNWQRIECNGLPVASSDNINKMVGNNKSLTKEQYLNKNFIFSGTIYGIYLDEDMPYIRIEDSYTSPSYYLNFSEVEKARRFNTGDRITVCGTITDIGGLYSTIKVENVTIAD